MNTLIRQAEKQITQTDKPKKQVTILCIEDNKYDVKFVQELLKESAEFYFDFIVVDRLEKAFDIKEQNKIDLILLDLYLPDSAGLETIVTLNSKTKNIPIVILSGLNDEEVAIKTIQEGAQDYIVKGQLEQSVLIRSICYAIERSKKEGIQLAKKEESAKQKLSDLHITKREREILTLVAKGKTNEGVAKELYLSISTVRNHLTKIFPKLKITNRTQATALALEAGLLKEIVK